MAKSVKVPKKAVAVKARAPRGKKVVIRGLLEDKRRVQGPSLVTPAETESRSLNPERKYSNKPSKRVQGQARGLLEDQRLVRGPSLVTPSAEDSRALNPERRRKKAPKQVQGQVRGLLEDKTLPRGPGLVTPAAEESRALNPERVRGKAPKKVQGPRIRESTPEEIKAAEDEYKRQIAEIDAEEAARGRNAKGKAAADAMRKKAMADFVAATRAPSAEPAGPDQGPGPKQTRDYLPPNLKPRLERNRRERFTEDTGIPLTKKSALVGGGLAALAGLGVGKGVDTYRTNQARLEDERDTELQRRESVLAGLVAESKAQSLDAAIQANLAEVQRQSPFLYNQVAAGRVLPQGAVVLGGQTRQDLLQELGRSMSEGQFSQ